jgi:phosphoribosyl 1,2-cyclic phosphodiesterase
MDHTFATPYFAPYYNPLNRFTVWGTQSVLDSLAAVLDPAARLSHVYFPPTYEEMKALKELRPLQPGDTFQLGSTTVRTHALNHPGGCLAFRLDNAGRSYVFATDHEQQQAPDLKLAEFARDADVLYTEGQYTQAEYDGQAGIGGDPPVPRRGWGHSPIEACVLTAVAAGVRTLHLGHRDPRRSDEELARVEHYAQELLRQELRRTNRPDDSCRVCIPAEGLTVRL